MLRARSILLLCGVAMMATSPALAQRVPEERNGARPSQPPPRLDEVGVDEKLGEHMLLDLTFRDHTGRSVKLSDYFDGERPVLLGFVRGVGVRIARHVTFLSPFSGPGSALELFVTRGVASPSARRARPATRARWATTMAS